MKLELNSVSADKLTIFPRLKFDLELYNEASEELIFYNFWGEASILRSADEAHSPMIFGTLIHDFFTTVLAGNSSKSLAMNLDMDIHKINAIEEIRQGKDLWVLIRILAVSCKRFDQTNIGTNELWVTRKGSGNRIKVPQSEWIQILEDFNYGNYKIIEMPLPRLPQGTNLDKAIGHLEQAHRKFNDGEYDDVLVDCRDAVEEIHAVLKSIEKKDKLLRGKFTDILGSEKEKRIEDLRSSFKLYVDLGGHKVIPEVKDIDRTDAELAILCAHELVNFYAKRLAKSSLT